MRELLALFRDKTVREFIETAIRSGLDKDSACDFMARELDELLDFTEIIPDPAVGAAVELVDYPLFRAAFGLAWTVAQRRVERQDRIDAMPRTDNPVIPGSSRKLQGIMSHASR